jgi:predicted phosphodiesterase
MDIRILSDLHNEFSCFGVPVMKNEENQVLVLAGDTGLLTPSKVDHTIFDFVDSLSERFYAVIIVAGNHEYYGCEFSKVNQMLALGTYPNNYERTGWKSNVYFLQDTSVVIDGVAFIGSTLWTDFDGGEHSSMQNAKLFMNDYHKITYKHNGIYRKFIPMDSYTLHCKSRDYIFGMVDHYRNVGLRTVVVSHHLPSFKSVHSKFADSALNGVYASNLDTDIELHRPDVWFHGHTHESCDYMICDTHVICNPRGYQQAGYPCDNSNFDSCKIIVV